MQKGDIWRKHIERSFNGGNNAIHVVASQDEFSKGKHVVIAVRIIEEDAWDGERSSIAFWANVDWEGGEMSEEQIIHHVKEIIHWEVSKMMRAME